MARRAFLHSVIPTGAARSSLPRRFLGRRAAQWRDPSSAFLWHAFLCVLCVLPSVNSVLPSLLLLLLVLLNLQFQTLNAPSPHQRTPIPSSPQPKLKLKRELPPQSSSPIKTAAVSTVLHNPRLSPTADCVMFIVRTILFEIR